MSSEPGQDRYAPAVSCPLRGLVSGPAPFPPVGDPVAPSLHELGVSGWFLPHTEKQCEGVTNTPSHKPRGSGFAGGELPPAHSRQVSAAPSHSLPIGQRSKGPPACPQTVQGQRAGLPTARLPASPLPQPQPLGRFYSSRYQMSIIGSEKQQTL